MTPSAPGAAADLDAHTSAPQTPGEITAGPERAWWPAGVTPFTPRCAPQLPEGGGASASVTATRRQHHGSHVHHMRVYRATACCWCWCWNCPCGAGTYDRFDGAKDQHTAFIAALVHLLQQAGS